MIKNYTDLEQSKKLAEILPLESADMAYYFMKDNGHLVNLSPFVLDGTEVRENGMFTYLNCWSLAALLNILTHIDEWYPGIDVVNKNMWQICMFSYQTGSDTDLSSVEEELVDACYELILKLNELKML